MDKPIAQDVTVLGVATFVIYPKDYFSRPKKEKENLWMVVKYKAADGTSFTALGTNLPVLGDVSVKLSGTWQESDRYGKALKVINWEMILPTSQRGVVSYLSSLKVGIGKDRAQRIFETFGDKIWEVLETDPDQLITVPGITANAVQKLKSKLDETKIDRELITLFQNVAEMTPRKLTELKSFYDRQVKSGKIPVSNGKLDLVQEIRSHPYQLCLISGFSFQIADRMGAKCQVPPNDQDRLFAAMRHVFQRAAVRGHTCVPKEEFRKMMFQELNRGTFSQKISEEDVTQAINEAWQREAIKSTRGCLYDLPYYRRESELADMLATRLRHKETLPPNASKFIEAFEAETSQTLAEQQKAAVLNMFCHRVSIITGGPGTGKTTTIKALLYAHRQAYGKLSNPILLSPTGRAARRMTEASGEAAMTIHKSVGYRGESIEIDGVDSDPMAGHLDTNLVIVDETSMMDLYIAHLLLKRIPDDARIVFVGDPNQLPSVGCGNVLDDLIRSGRIPTTKLNVIFRQAETSPIVAYSHAIVNCTGMENLPKLNNGNGFALIECQNSEAIFLKACALYLKSVQAYGIDNVILLNPYREKGTLTVQRFNRNLQHLLNPLKDGDFEMSKSSLISFRVGDRVMQMKNTDYVANGDVGVIKRITQLPDPEEPTKYTYQATIEFNGDGVEHIYNPEDIMDLDLAYCTTVHKAQGSEYKTVIMVLSKEHETMLRQSVLYTGMTRAKENLAVLTEAAPTGETAIDKAILNRKTDKRYSMLAERLQFALPTSKE